MIGVTVLGATGSIGCSTLEVLRLHPERYRAVAITANRDVENLYRQCVEFRPDYAVMADASAATVLRERLAKAGLKTEVLEGEQGLQDVASLPEVDAVMAAIVGAAGLLSALAAVRAGKRVLLANKEALVVSGQLFMDEVQRHGAEVLPIDSEHNAVFQCMPSGFREGLERVGVRRILLTASGGPFRAAALADLHDVTPEQACNHPNWDMGPKISVDSATMMNKGLEVIEARWLFDTSPDNIRVVVHPQSVIHSMVEYVDGSILAQMGNPDMRTPIAHALGWPERIQSGVESLNLFDVARLDFQRPDFERFPCLRLAYSAIREGGAAPAVLNAANEVAVAAFLAGQLGFMRIAEVVERVMDEVSTGMIRSLEDVLDADRRARAHAEQTIATRVSS